MRMCVESDVDNWTPLGIMKGHTFGMNKKCSTLKPFSFTIYSENKKAIWI